jgi:hypothetical protein
MSDFLPALRATGAFTGRTKPFGMPDIDSGNLGSLLRQISPVARRMNELSGRRRGDMQQFQQSVSQAHPTKDNLYYRGSAIRSGALGSRDGGSAPPTGTQQRMWKQDDDKFDAKNRQLEQQNRIVAAMDEAKMRNEGETSRLMQELNARRGMNQEDNATRMAVSQNELAARAGETAAERAFRISEGKADRASRERVAGMPARAQPTPQSQMDDMLNNRVQQLRLQNPQAAALLVQDPETKQYGFAEGATPEQQKFIRDYLQGAKPKPKPGQGMAPAPVHGKK